MLLDVPLQDNKDYEKNYCFKHDSISCETCIDVNAIANLKLVTHVIINGNEGEHKNKGIFLLRILQSKRK